MSNLRILIVDGRTTGSAVASALRRRGHDVVVVEGEREALARPPPDVLVAEAGPSTQGLDLLARMRARGLRPHAVIVDARPSIESCRRALLLGAADYLTKPVRLEDLVRAVEAARVEPAEPEASSARVFDREYGADAAEIARATAELAAHLVRLRIVPSCRARVTSAAAEVFDNVRRHAYAGQTPAGAFRVRVEHGERVLTVTVEDRGVGFDAARVAESAFDSPMHNGLARAACLAEDVDLDGRPGRGARVALRFEIYDVAFGTEGAIDLTEADHLTPETARRVLEALRGGADDEHVRLSPALAVVVGRLLAGPDARKRLQLALWT